MAFSQSKVVKNFGSTLPMTRRNIHVIIVLSKNISKRDYTALAEVVKNIGTPLPYTEIGICAIIVSCKTGTTPNPY